MTSWKYVFDLNDLKKWTRASLLIFIPWVIVFLQNYLNTWTFDFHLLIVSIVPSIIDLIRRFSIDYTLPIQWNNSVNPS